MTPLGQFLRDLLNEKGMLLNDLSECLNVKSAYLSAITHGKKGKPSDQFLQNIVKCLELSSQEIADLDRHAMLSDTKFSVPPKAKPSVYETANMFARKMATLSDEQLKKIKEVIDE